MDNSREIHVVIRPSKFKVKHIFWMIVIVLAWFSLCVILGFGMFYSLVKFTEWMMP